MPLPHEARLPSRIDSRDAVVQDGRIGRGGGTVEAPARGTMTPAPVGIAQVLALGTLYRATVQADEP